MQGSDPRYLEDVLSGFDTFDSAPSSSLLTTGSKNSISFPYLCNTSLNQIEKSNELSKRIYNTWNCLNELESSFLNQLQNGDEEIVQYIETLRKRFYEVFLVELESQIESLGQNELIKVSLLLIMIRNFLIVRVLCLTRSKVRTISKIEAQKFRYNISNE